MRSLLYLALNGMINAQTYVRAQLYQWGVAQPHKNLILNGRLTSFCLSQFLHFLVGCGLEEG